MGAVASPSAGSTFVGREPELTRLTRLLDLAADGSAAAVMLGGDAGVGKTRVVGELVERLSGPGRSGSCAVGRCIDIGAGGLPYLPFVEAFTMLAGHPQAGPALRRVIAERPALNRLTGAADEAVTSDDALHRLPLYEAVAEALRAVGDHAGPLLLVLEDLHWADASTRDLLRFLLARLAQDRVLVLATFRSDELHRRHPLRSLLAELVRLPRVERLELRPFDDRELRAFLAALRGDSLPEGRVRDIAARSEGNAFFAAELLVAAEPDPADPLPGSGPLPSGLSDVLLARLDRMPEPVQHVARVAAVAGRRVSDPLLRMACQLPDTAVDQALRDAVAHQVLVGETGDRFAFRHALVQEAVYADLLPGERVALHARYAALLAAADDTDDLTVHGTDLARHHLEAHQYGAALGAYLRAAQSADQRMAPAEALSCYEQVLQLWDVVPAPERPEGESAVSLSLSAAGAASQAGDSRRAARLAAAAARTARSADQPEAEAEARHRLASYLYATDRHAEALEEVARVRELLAGSGPSPARVWAAGVEAKIRGGSEDAWEARREQLLATRALVESARAEARTLGMVTAEADLMVTLAATDGILHGFEAAARRLAEAARLGARSRDPGLALRIAFNTGVNELDVGRLAAARRTLTAGLAAAERAGLAGSLYAVQCRLVLAQVLVVAGDWDDAVRCVTQDRPPLPEQEVANLLAAVLPVHGARDPERLLALLDHPAPGSPSVQTHAVAGPLVDALTWLQRTQEAAAGAERTLARFADLDTPLSMGGLLMGALGLSALADAAGEPARTATTSSAPLRARGTALLDLARTIAASGPTRLADLGPEGRAWLARAEAEATRLAGRPDLDAFRATLVAFEGYGHRYETARSRAQLARTLLVTRRPPGGAGPARREAAELLVAARDSAAGLGAAPLVEAVRAMALRHRVDIGSGTGTPTLLTPREEEVMRLVAQGLTNRAIGAALFISEKTASVHVSNVIAKLGASGRTEAVALAHRRGLFADPAPSR